MSVTSLTTEVMLVWFAGLSNVCDDMQFMLGKRPEIYWRVTWVLFAPVILSVIIFIDFLHVYRRCRTRSRIWTVRLIIRLFNYMCPLSSAAIMYRLIWWEVIMYKVTELLFLSGNIHRVSSKVQATRGWKLRLPRLGRCSRLVSRMPVHGPNTILGHCQHLPTERLITEKCEHFCRDVRR